jgi:hypothetical protein
MTFDRLWQFPGELTDDELRRVLASALEAPAIRALFDALLVRAGRDRDLEDQLQFEAFQYARSLYPNAVTRDGNEIACHLFGELGRERASRAAESGQPG